MPGSFERVPPRERYTALAAAAAGWLSWLIGRSVAKHRRAGRAGSPVGAVAVHPGVSATNLFNRQLVEGGRTVLAPLSRVLTKVALQSATAGSLPTLRALDHSTPSGAFVGPARFGQTRGRPELLDVYHSGKDPAVAARLWELTEDVLGAPLPV